MSLRITPLQERRAGNLRGFGMTIFIDQPGTAQPAFAAVELSGNVPREKTDSAGLHPGVADGPTASLAGRDSGDSVERHAPHSIPHQAASSHAPATGPVLPSSQDTGPVTNSSEVV